MLLKVKGWVMIKCKFEYTEGLLKKINTTSLKVSNLINELLLFIILVGSVILFVTGNLVLGIVLAVVFVLFAVSLYLFNEAIYKSNIILRGQQVHILFNEGNMDMSCSRGENQLYKANFEYVAIKKLEVKQDLIYVYFDKKSVIIIPKLAFTTETDYNKAIELLGNNYMV